MDGTGHNSEDDEKNISPRKPNKTESPPAEKKRHSNHNKEDLSDSETPQKEKEHPHSAKESLSGDIQSIIIISKRFIKNAKKPFSPRKPPIVEKEHHHHHIEIRASHEILAQNNNNININNNPESVVDLTKKEKIKFEDLPIDIQNKCTDIDKELIDNHMNILYNILTFLYKHHFKMGNENIDFTKYRASVPEEKLSKSRGLIDKTTSKSLKKHQFKKFQVSGKGAFGSVFLVKDKTMKKFVALKKLPHDTQRNQMQNESEVYFLSECKHPNIVEFYKCYEVKSKGQTQIWIVTEFLEGGTLAEAASLYNFSEKHIAYTARECLKGIKYLHEKGFVHRDLKSSNVMMSVKGEVKIIDFGLCADLSEGPRNKIMGSPYWIPPEMILNQTHSYLADIWSFAVCILELFLNNPPYPESPVKCMLMAATRGLKDQIPETASTQAREFLSLCLTIDQEQRATAEHLLQNEWVIQPNLEEGIEDILYQIFLSNSLSVLGL